MIEERNRIEADRLSDLFYVTEPSAIDYLLAEGVPSQRIVHVGNLMVDNLDFVSSCVLLLSTTHINFAILLSTFFYIHSWRNNRRNETTVI
jgi:UDP-N-acetylglucosamine 2-epimerase